MSNITDIEHSLGGDITVEYSDKSVTTGKGLFLDGDIIKSLDNTKIFNTSNYISKDPTTGLITDPAQRAAVGAIHEAIAGVMQTMDGTAYKYVCNLATASDKTAEINRVITAASVLSGMASGRYIEVDLGGADVTIGTVQMKTGVILVNGTVRSGAIDFNGISRAHLRQIKFKDHQTNSVNFSNCSVCSVTFCEFDTIGLSGSLNASYQGFGVYVGSSSRVFVGHNKFQETRGQGAVGFMSSRECTAYNNDFDDTYYRAVHTYGALADGINEPLRHAIFDNRIKNCGRTNPSASAVGCNGIYMSANGPLGYVPQDHYCYNNIVSYVGENGIEGHGTIINNEVWYTNYFGKTTPSIEGIYVTNGTVAANNRVYYAAGHGILISINRNNVEVYDNKVYWPGKDGISCNKYDGASERLTNFKIMGNHVEMKAAAGQYYPYNIFDTNGSVTTFDASCIFARNTSNVSKYNIQRDGFDRETAVAIPTSGAWKRGQVLRNRSPAAGAPAGWVCTASGDYDLTVSLTGTVVNNTYRATNVTGSDLSKLRPGDTVKMPTQSSSGDNATLKRFEITSIVGTTLYFDAVNYGDNASTSITNIAPTWSALPNL